MTFAQDEASAQHAGMPQSAIASGAIDLVLPPEAIAARLDRTAAAPLSARRRDVPEAPDRDGSAEEFQRVIAALRAQHRRRFQPVSRLHHQAAHRPAHAAARIHVGERLRPVHRTRPRRSQRALSRRPDQRHQLLPRPGDVRGPQAAASFRRSSTARPTGMPVRVWVPGCSTGQEAYSLAIALLEFLDTAKTTRAIQIFATDLGDPAALDKARAGLYPGKHRGRGQPRAAAPVLHQGGAPLSHPEERPRPVRLRAPERHRRIRRSRASIW